jgi:hypothetical protein
MPRVLVQTAGGKLAREHLERTVRTGVPVSHLRQFLPPGEADRLAKFYAGQPIPTWGIISHRDGERAWEGLWPADTVMFVRDWHIALSGVIVGKCRNAELARSLAPVRPQQEIFSDGETRKDLPALGYLH